MTAPLASQLFALSQNNKCEGKLECHWCGAPCTDRWPHDNLPNVYFIKPFYAKRPGNSYICAGCWSFRRKRVTIHFLDGKFKDGQTPKELSWFISEQKAFAVRIENSSELYKQLLNPPKCFVLGLLDNPCKTPNNLHQMLVNFNQEIKADTILYFTINNIPHNYTIYDLESALSNEMAGKTPGVAALCRLFGPYEMEKRDKGRPAKEEVKTPNRIVKNKTPPTLSRNDGVTYPL